MGRIIGLDVGDKRIGVAVSDCLGLTAQGVKTIIRDSKADVLKELQQIINAFSAQKVVVGLPRNMNGTYGPQADKVKEFAQLLADTVGIAVVYWDERLTSVAAEKTLLAGNVARRKRKQVIDKLAAVLILQDYLDNCKKGG